MPPSVDRTGLVRRRSRLLDEQFGETRLACELMEAELEESDHGLDDLLFGAELAGRAQRHELAVRLYERAQSLDPSSRSKARLAHAAALMRAKKRVESRALIDAVLAENASNADALKLLADHHAAEHEWKDAVLAFEADCRCA